MPWANDGGNNWNATRCSPIDGDPDQLGEECTVEGSGVSGLDSCDVGLMCFDVDGGTNVGECIALCECGPDSPQCSEEGALCSVSNEGSLPICLGGCDPLVPGSCEDGSGCYPIGQTFVCAPDASGAVGAQGDECVSINACDPGLGCVNPAVVVDCPGDAAGCCTAFCDLDAAEECPALSQCEAWFAEGTAPPGLENVGICAVE